MFRPSDDATIYPFLIPSNLFAINSLLNLKTINHFSKFENEFISQIDKLVFSISEAVNNTLKDSKSNNKSIIPYEVDGFGNFSVMDDANIPSVLSLPYLVGMNVLSESYHNTRKILLSENNPFFFKGKAAEGIGGPHVGIDYIWPLSIIMRGLTSTDDKEIKTCLTMLQKTHGNTGFMHESFHKDDATKFTRKWFAWANTLFGEFVWKVYKERPHLLN